MTSFVGRGHPLGNVRALSIDCDRNATRSSVKTLGRRVVTDVKNAGAGDVGDVDIGLGGDLATHHYLPGRHDGFHGSVRMGVLGQHSIKDSVGNGVGNLVRVAFRY